MSKRPNILYFMTDQHRADWLGCAGHPVVKTPNIDSMAARGTRFTEFHVTTPVCMPNRGAIFTGRYPSVNGLRHNGLPLPEAANTFVDILRDAGYHTASIGKSHLQPFTTGDVKRADEVHVANAAFPEAIKADGGDYSHEKPEHSEIADPYAFPESYYGFNHVRMVTNHSDKCGGHYLQWLRSQTNEWCEMCDWANQKPHAFTCPQAVRTPIPEELYPTSYIKEEAKAYLRDRAGEDEPFFAFVSFPDPHYPFTPPGKHWDMYDPEDFSVDLPYAAHKSPPVQLAESKRLMDAGIVPGNLQQAFMAPDQHLKEAMALTAGMITMIDDAIGEILAELEASGRAEDTIIVYNSDHGDYMGAFNLLLKGPLANERVNRVPFIWVDPEAPAICPWNVPLLMASMKVAPALVMGNAAVLKPSEETPSSATVLAEVIAASDIPDWAFSLVHGFGVDSAGAFLTSHPKVDAITFTGESGTGSAIMKVAANGLCEVSLELGGKNAALVFEDARMDAVAEGMTRSAFFNCGQICFCTERAYVHRSRFERVRGTHGESRQWHCHW